MVSLGMRDADLVLTVHFSAFFIPGACRDTIILWYLIALVTFGLEIAERQNRLDKIGRGKNLSDQQAESLDAEREAQSLRFNVTKAVHWDYSNLIFR